MTIKFEVLKPDRLRELFHYDPGAGTFTYRTRASRNTHPGDVAGSVNSEGYRQIRVDGRCYKAHRLAWLYVKGIWPTELVDHVNGYRDDNRFDNLREATRSENLANSRVFRRGKSTPKGVRPSPHGFSARIQAKKQSYFLGYFKSEIEASAAYEAAARNLFGEYARVAS